MQAVAPSTFDFGEWTRPTLIEKLTATQQIRVTFKIKADVSEEKLDYLVRIAQERSPVFDCVSNPVNVAVTRAR